MTRTGLFSKLKSQSKFMELHCFSEQKSNLRNWPLNALHPFVSEGLRDILRELDKMHSVCWQQESLLSIVILKHRLMMKARVQWVGLRALLWPPHPSPFFAHSALMLGGARNVHTYRHKHAAVAWKLVAAYLTMSWRRVEDLVLIITLQDCFCLQIPSMTSAHVLL